MSEETTRLETLVAPVLAEHDLALYDLTLTGQGKARTVRVSVERTDGGPVDLEAIAATSRALDPIFESDDALRGAFTLEVSSPGLERPLRRPDHFARARGQIVSCKVPGNERMRGTLLGSDDTGFDLELDGEVRRITYAEVTNVRTVFEWGAAEGPVPRDGSRKEKSKR